MLNMSLSYSDEIKESRLMYVYLIFKLGRDSKNINHFVENLENKNLRFLGIGLAIDPPSPQAKI